MSHTTTRRRALAALAAFAALALPAAAETLPLLVLDPGHTPQAPGALSVRGMYEVGYNDRFAEELAPLLRAAGWQVVLTRERGQTMTLAERADLANRLRADLFLSIHHDSTRDIFVTPTEYEGRPAQRTNGDARFRGYSLYVSERNAQLGASYTFALLLAQRIRALGRPPALYHADLLYGSGRPLYDEHHGIYRYDNLAVLRRTEVPAVLLEIGVLPDETDEAWLSTPENRHAMQRAIVQAALEYQKSRFYRAAP